MNFRAFMTPRGVVAPQRNLHGRVRDAPGYPLQVESGGYLNLTRSYSRLSEAKSVPHRSRSESTYHDRQFLFCHTTCKQILVAMIFN